ncbi:MAG: MBL fold metallo-hydrolase [Clostridia bacterium]|nr:MBL fold metallo-hydrolase [Clostridia bacterium]
MNERIENMKIYVLSSQQCEDSSKNNGDCFVIDNSKELVVYDCGCEYYANWVIDYMKKHNYSKTKVVLSHNDDDHFKGIPVLVDNNKTSEITTVLLLKYVDDILDIIDDGRKNREALKEQIKDTYDNIEQLSGHNLKDAFEHIEIAEGIRISGPGKDYILNAAAKGLDTTEGDTIDSSTITNATSIHLEVSIGDKKVLLTGDSSFESVKKEKLEEFRVIQLPHHGNAEIGEKIFEETKDDLEKQYIISDNTGNSNGGSDKLETKGYRVMNTKEKGMLTFDENQISQNRKTVGNLG